jgi:hypothetical protein
MPSRAALGLVRDDLGGEPDLAVATRAGQCHQPLGGHERVDGASSACRPTKLVSWIGRVFGTVSSDRSRSGSAVESRCRSSNFGHLADVLRQA